ncbi:NXPE family member 3-like [Clavelina lepadiformis]|uniref:NXPE family member 3-like n=1 Tax=Clavelina lepadiformis TaxID=159417 RepID=UPI004043402A
MRKLCKRKLWYLFLGLIAFSFTILLLYKHEIAVTTLFSKKIKPVVNEQQNLDSHQKNFDNLNNLLKNVTIPEEVLDPNSVWFGMKYKNTYGLPLSNDAIPPFKREEKDWINFFPDLLKSRQNYHLKNPLQDSDFFTRITSKVVTRNKLSYSVGDVFVAHIQARDQLMRNKMFGGDYFRARFIRTRFGEAVDGIPCAIYDHANGTYTVKAPLLMSGDFTLEVKLLLSVEGIDRWINFTEAPTIKRSYHHTLLKSNKKVVCGFHLDKFIEYNAKDLCDYSNPRTEEPWFCVRPPSGVCHPIVEHFVKVFRLDKLFLETSTTFGKFGEITGSGLKIEVTPKKEFSAFGHYGTEYRGTVLPSGYFQNGRWESLQQTLPIESVASSRDCFSNKIVFFLGDSTIRQFFEAAVNTFKLTHRGLQSGIDRQAPHIAESKENNITIYYRTHGMPLELTGLASTRPYVSDIIESLDFLQIGGPDVYLVLNVGVHMIHYHAFDYLHRLMGIKKAIVDHLKIHPETRFIIRGMNVVECTHEWALFRFETIMREVFKDLKDTVVLNLWDLTTIIPLADYHPKNVALDEEVRLLFSYVCNWNV